MFQRGGTAAPRIGNEFITYPISDSPSCRETPFRKILLLWNSPSGPPQWTDIRTSLRLMASLFSFVPGTGGQIGSNSASLMKVGFSHQSVPRRNGNYTSLSAGSLPRIDMQRRTSNGSTAELTVYLRSADNITSYGVKSTQASPTVGVDQENDRGLKLCYL